MFRTIVIILSALSLASCGGGGGGGGAEEGNEDGCVGVVGMEADADEADEGEGAVSSTDLSFGEFRPSLSLFFRRRPSMFVSRLCLRPVCGLDDGVLGSLTSDPQLCDDDESSMPASLSSSSAATSACERARSMGDMWPMSASVLDPDLRKCRRRSASRSCASVMSMTPPLFAGFGVAWSPCCSLSTPSSVMKLILDWRASRSSAKASICLYTSSILCFMVSDWFWFFCRTDPAFA